jgi:aminoglycoside N3'-acetyltransferase
MSSERLTRERLAADLRQIGIREGDTVLVRGSLKPVGHITGGAQAVVGALIDAVGTKGNIMSLAFTGSAFIRRADAAKAFTLATPTYAGALPQAMRQWPGAVRSAHRTCSYVAIGPDASELLRGHDAAAGAYDPVRLLVQRQAVGLLIGCVDSSPGFTTAHLAEVELGLHRRMIAPWANSTWYVDQDGQLRLFRRRDHGLCSIGFRNFYGPYVNAGILRSGFVGQAYSITAPLHRSHAIEKELLQRNPRFSICGEADCLICNARRWDRIHHLPLYAARRMMRRLAGKRARDGGAP